VRACRLGPDGVSQNIDFSKRDAAAGGGSEFTGMQLEAGGKISAITCSPGVKGCMALTTPSRLRIFDVEAGAEFLSKDFETEGGIHSMCWSPTGATCLAALKNKTIVVHDPRAPLSSPSIAFPGHAAVAPNRLVYLKEHYFCSAGKGAGSIMIWIVMFLLLKHSRLFVVNF
jgi:WD40 repeat protein